MAWRLDGTYFENCNCNVACPCTVADFAAPADNDRCQVVLSFHVHRGRIDEVDVSGLTVAVVADTPKLMLDGNWRVGVFMDASASSEQAEKLGGVFSGQMGGPMAALGPLIGEMLGVEQVPIEYHDDGKRHRVKIGDGVEIEVEDITPPANPEGHPHVSGVSHPANSTLNVARGVSSRISAFGIEFDGRDRSAFSAPFSWSA